MLKNGIKNYFINFKNLFTPIGTLAIGVALGLSVLIPGILAAIQNLADEVSTATSNVGIDFNILWDNLVQAVGKLDWNEPVAAICTMFDRVWLTDTFSACLGSLIVDGESYMDLIVTAVNNAVASVVSCVVVFVFWIIVGLIVGYFLTKVMVRRTMARRKMWKIFLASFVDSVLTAGLAVAIFALGAMWTPSVAISAVITLLLVGVFSLVEAYLVHGYKIVDAKSVVNIKNTLLLWLSDLIIFLITCVLSVIAVAINAVAGILVVIALFEITFLVMSLNSESYVLDLVAKKKEKEVSEAKTEAEIKA